VGYGYDKVSHTTQLHAAGYTFKVLPDVWIIHAEHGTPEWRGKGDLVRVRVWLNYYAFLGEIALKYSTEPVTHSHTYEGKDWEEEVQSYVPLYVTVIVLCIGVMFYTFISHLARARKAGKYLL
jgi:hypothetical protein